MWCVGAGASAWRSVPGVVGVVGHLLVCVRRIFIVIMCFRASRSMCWCGMVSSSSMRVKVACVTAVSGIARVPDSIMAAAGVCVEQCWCVALCNSVMSVVRSTSSVSPSSYTIFQNGSRRCWYSSGVHLPRTVPLYHPVLNHLRTRRWSKMSDVFGGSSDRVWWSSGGGIGAFCLWIFL